LKSDYPKAILLSILMITALLLPLLSISINSVTSTIMTNPPQFGAIPGTWIVRGQDNAFSIDVLGNPPDVLYDNDSIGTPGNGPTDPPIVAVGTSGSGKVAAAGISWSCQNASAGGSAEGWDRPGNHYPHLDVLIDNIFRFIRKSGGTNKVLWYYGHATHWSSSQCSEIRDALLALGWQFGTDNRPFDQIDNLNAYDILWINQMQCAPDNLATSELDVISQFVHDNGKGLLITASSDVFGYSYAATQNRVLGRLAGIGFRLQDDSVYDEVNPGDTTGRRYYPDVYLDTSTAIGLAYQTATGSNLLTLYGPDSLEWLSSVTYSVDIKPYYRDVMPDSRVTFSLICANHGTVLDNYQIDSVVDNLSWVSVGIGRVDNVFPENTGTLSIVVNVPSSAAYFTQDNIEVVVKSMDNSDMKKTLNTTVYVGTWIAPATDDTQVAENASKVSSPQGQKTYMYVGSSNNNFLNERAYLRFNLGDNLPAGYTITSVRLYLWCFTSLGGALNKQVDVYGLDNDNWNDTIMWSAGGGFQGPPTGTQTYCDNVVVFENYNWYSWDVTSFINTQRTIDNIVSFMVRADNENHPPSPDNFSYGFDASEDNVPSRRPYLAFGVRPNPDVFTTASGRPTQTVTVKAVIYNNGSVTDSYNVNIENSDDNWVVSPTSVVITNVAPGDNKPNNTITITVTIPANATVGKWENLKITATSQTDSNFSGVTNEKAVWVGDVLNVVAGWNMIGFQGTSTLTKSMPAGWTYPDNYTCYYYNAPGGPYGIQGITAAFNDNTGYWLWVSSSTPIYENGIPPTSRSISLAAGWNLVHFPVDNASTTPANLFPGWNYPDNYIVYYYNAPGGPYGVQGTTAPLKDNTAYWVWVIQAKTVTVPAP
jgi:hypothetical protein